LFIKPFSLRQDPSVAVVILNFNGKKYLEQFLPSVLASTYANKKIVVADNASSDESVLFLKQNYPTVDLILLKENYGFAKGYNEALRYVDADYFVLLNSDVEVTAGWIEPVIQLMESDTSIAAAQPKLLAFHDRTSFEYAGASGGYIDYLGYPFSRGRIFDTVEKDKGQYDNVQQIFWASGAAMFVRASVYESLGGLDPYFFAHQEEIDLCWRMQLAGYSIYSVPQSVVYHVGGGTLPKGNSLKTYLNFRNNLIMISKNRTGVRKHLTLFLRFGLDAVSAWKALFSGDVGFWKAVFKAHLGYFNWLFNHQKQSVFPTNKDVFINTIFTKSVVWQYFVKKQKTYSTVVQ
jgi:GT2 family glycosyltransferase